MIIFELDLDFKYPSTQQLNFIDELESIGIKLKSVSSATKVYFDNEEIDPSETITIANPVSGTHYFKNDLGTQIKCVFIAKQSSINFQPNQPDMSDYYTKEETDEAIEEAIEGIDFPEPEIPETSTIPRKSGMEGNCAIGYSSEGVEVSQYGQAAEYSYFYANEIPTGNTVVFNEPYFGLMIKESGTSLTTTGQSFNFPDKLLFSEIYYDINGESSLPANEIYHTGYTTVDGYVFRGDSDFADLIVENVRGFINKDPLSSGGATLLVKNCGILAHPGVFENVAHLVVDGEIKYFSNLLFSVRESENSSCVHMTFTGRGLLNAELLATDITEAGLSAAASTNPFTIEFPDITFNEFVDWCSANDMGLYHVYDDLFNGSAISKLVFKDQTITDVNQTKLDDAEPDLVATLADGTVLPCRNASEAEGWLEVIGGAVKLEIFNTEGEYPEAFSDANCFQNCTELKEVIDTRGSGTAYVFPQTLDSLTVARYDGLYGNNAKNAYITYIDPGTGYYLFDEDRVIDNVYFTHIENPVNVEQYLGTQNADAKIYFAGVLAATYSGFYHELTWKNGFEPTT